MKTRKQTIQMLKRLSTDLRRIQQRTLDIADMMAHYDSSTALWAQDLLPIAGKIHDACDCITPFLPDYLQEIFAEVDAKFSDARELNNQEAVS